MNEEHLLELRIQHKIRAAFIAVFQGTGDYGALALSAIANRCGCNETEAERVKPDLVAFHNWLLSMLGIREGEEPNINLTDPNALLAYTQEAKALLSVANMNDVTQELSQIGGETDGSGTQG
jgi:hypothetical protein